VGDGRRSRRLIDAAAVLAGAALMTGLFALLDLPSPALFGGLVAGLVRALTLPDRLELPGVAMTSAQALVGVAMGSLIDLETLATVGADWLPVLLVTVGTLVLSLASGLLLRLQRGISPVTGAFAMIAGGASGITAMARDLGADARMVGVLQYLRVLLIVVLMPVVAVGLYGADTDGGGAVAEADPPGWLVGVVFTAACAVAGVLLGRLARFPVASLLGPLIVAAVADLSGLSQGAEVPYLLQQGAFLVIGLQVGVSFTRQSLRTIGRALPPALAIIFGLIVACAGLGVLLSAWTDVSLLDGYLATTPGGLYAVLATAADSGADTTFVLAVQVLRLFVMLLSAPLLARYLRRGYGDGKRAPT
jgi:membrane AbrB-like protein